MRVVVIHSEINRSKSICAAVLHGIDKLGDDVTLIDEKYYNGPGDEYDVAVFYGLRGNLINAWRDYPRVGKKSVYIDLPYWGRDGIRGHYDGYHKFVVNGRHATKYLQRVKHPDDRFRAFGLEVKHWTYGGDHILVAGMSAKAAAVEGFGFFEWERKAIKAIQKFTNRPIWFRPKTALPAHLIPDMPGVEIDNGPLKESLKNCHAVVSHHSNVGIDALLGGVPIFTDEGVALRLGLSDLSKIETPRREDGRPQLMYDIAYTQFNGSEMWEGIAWRHLREEGLV